MVKEHILQELEMEQIIYGISIYGIHKCSLKH